MVSIITRIFFTLTLFVITAKAVPEDGAAAPPPAGGGGGDVTTMSPEELALDEKITELVKSQCKLSFGNCYLHKTKEKPYFSEGKRQKLCLKHVKGFSPCFSMTIEIAEEAKVEALERKQRAEEAEEERKKLIEEEKLRREEKKKEQEEAKAAKENAPGAEDETPAEE